jgi:hypothetical protein
MGIILLHCSLRWKWNEQIVYRLHYCAVADAGVMENRMKGED